MPRRDKSKRRDFIVYNPDVDVEEESHAYFDNSVIAYLNLGLPYYWGSTVVPHHHLLAYAARLNRVDAVAALVHFRQDVNVQLRDGRTPLHIAAAHGYVDVVRALVVGKPRFDLKDKDGKTALWLAVDNSDMDAAAALLDAGATPHARRSDRTSPIHTACEHGHVEMVKLLLAHSGGKLSFSDLRIEPMGLLDTALTQSEAMIEAMVASFQPSEAGQALHNVARRGRLNAVKALLAVHAPVDWTNTDYVNTPLYVAAQAGYVDVVKALLAAGARVDCGDIDARTREAERRERWFARYFGVEARVFVRTPMEIAAENGHDEVENVLRAATYDGSDSNAAGTALL